MFRVLKVLGLCLLLSLFSACGGGGGGGGGVPVAPPLSLTGTVTDSTLAPVAGATVTARYQVGNASRALEAQTDAAGRYQLRGVPAGQAVSVSADAGPGYFPAAASVTLVRGIVSVLDFSLPSTRQFETVNAAAGGTATSTTFIDPQGLARVTIPAGCLASAGGSLFGGEAKVYVTPADVSRIGNGFGHYQVMPLAVAAVPGIDELFAAAAFEVTDTAGAPMQLGAGCTASLELPVPVSLAGSAPETISLQRFDAATGAWADTGVVAAADTYPNPARYLAEVPAAGFWRAAASAPASSITGILNYSDGTPAAGATVFLTGKNYGYQQIVIADETGAFTAKGKTGADLSVEGVVWGYGVQLSHSLEVPGLTDLTGALGTVGFGFGQPAADVPAAAVVALDEMAIAAPAMLGLILGSGRVTADQNVIAEIADLSFVANAFDGTVGLAVTGSGAGLQEIPGGAFDALDAVPTTGYREGFAGAVRLDAATPLVVAVRTAAGHYGKISIDEVEEIPGPGQWRITFRAAFSLDPTF